MRARLLTAATSLLLAAAPAAAQEAAPDTTLTPKPPSLPPAPIVPAWAATPERLWCGVDTRGARVVARSVVSYSDGVSSARRLDVVAPADSLLDVQHLYLWVDDNPVDTTNAVRGVCVGRVARAVNADGTVRYDVYLPSTAATARTYTRRWSTSARDIERRGRAILDYLSAVATVPAP
jgi:hypothetical protein